MRLHLMISYLIFIISSLDLTMTCLHLLLFFVKQKKYKQISRQQNTDNTVLKVNYFQFEFSFQSERDNRLGEPGYEPVW